MNAVSAALCALIAACELASTQGRFADGIGEELDTLEEAKDALRLYGWEHDRMADTLAEFLTIARTDAWNGSMRLDDVLDDARDRLREYREPIQLAGEANGMDEVITDRLQRIAVALNEEDEEN
jgi:hypothetical protein